MAAGEKLARLASWLVFFGVGAFLFFGTYSPEPTNTYRYPIADISGNVSGDPYEMGRLLIRWQTQEGMENSFENVMGIPWGASLVLLEVSKYDQATLVYIGELGPDYPLMYAEEKVAKPTKVVFGYSDHEWSLQGNKLVLYSTKVWYTDWLRLVISIVLGLLLKAIVSFLFKVL